jgi:hypothetical protein
MSASLRSAVWQRARGFCEYCLLHEDDALLAHEPDHIIATQHGGLTGSKNLALACCVCNRLKGPNIASVDPATGKLVRLFHPRMDAWTDHFRLDGARIEPLTPPGRATTALLRLNSRRRLSERQALRYVGRYPL